MQVFKIWQHLSPRSPSYRDHFDYNNVEEEMGVTLIHAYLNVKKMKSFVLSQLLSKWNWVVIDVGGWVPELNSSSVHTNN